MLRCAVLCCACTLWHLLLHVCNWTALVYVSNTCRHYMDLLLPIIKRQDFTAVITHRLPLADGAHAYRMFDSKEAGCIKVVMRPWPGTEGTTAAV